MFPFRDAEAAVAAAAFAAAAFFGAGFARLAAVARRFVPLAVGASV
jgi:hypothetical protein